MFCEAVKCEIPNNLEMNFYTFNFLPEMKMKISYTSSFGVITILKNKEKTVAYLPEFNY